MNMLKKKWNRIVTGILLAAVLSLTTACGNKADDAANQAGVSEAAGSSTDAGMTGTEENEMLGTFRDGGTLLILEEDGTFAKINASEQSCEEGTYSISGNTASLTDNETGNTSEGKFQNGAWTLKGTSYIRSVILGNYTSEKNGDGITVMNANTFVAYKDFAGKKGKSSAAMNGSDIHGNSFLRVLKKEK